MADRAVGLAARADDHRGAEVRQRRALGGQRQRRLVAAAQVLGDALVAEPAEVDDATDALARGHAREVARAVVLTLLEARAAGHRVDEEVGDVDLLAGAAQARLVVHVAAADLAADALELTGTRRIAHETAHGRAVGDQRLGEATADEAGCSG